MSSYRLSDLFRQALADASLKLVPSREEMVGILRSHGVTEAESEEIAVGLIKAYEDTRDRTIQQHERIIDEVSHQRPKSDYLALRYYKEQRNYAYFESHLVANLDKSKAASQSGLFTKMGLSFDQLVAGEFREWESHRLALDRKILKTQELREKYDHFWTDRGIQPSDMIAMSRLDHASLKGSLAGLQPSDFENEPPESTVASVITLGQIAAAKDDLRTPSIYSAIQDLLPEMTELIRPSWEALDPLSKAKVQHHWDDVQKKLSTLRGNTEGGLTSLRFKSAPSLDFLVGSDSSDSTTHTNLGFLGLHEDHSNAGSGPPTRCASPDAASFLEQVPTREIVNGGSTPPTTPPTRSNSHNDGPLYDQTSVTSGSPSMTGTSSKPKISRWSRFKSHFKGINRPSWKASSRG